MIEKNRTYRKTKDDTIFKAVCPFCSREFIAESQEFKYITSINKDCPHWKHNFFSKRHTLIACFRKKY